MRKTSDTQITFPTWHTEYRLSDGQHRCYESACTQFADHLNLFNLHVVKDLTPPLHLEGAPQHRIINRAPGESLSIR